MTPKIPRKPRVKKTSAPVVVNASMDLVAKTIQDLAYAQEDSVNETFAAIFSNPMMSAMMGGSAFAGQLVAFSVYQAAEHVLMIEDGVRLYPQIPSSDVERAKLQYRKALASARKTLGKDFDALYEAVRLEHNENARFNLDQSKGMMNAYVVPKFNDDGTHDPLGPRDFPWDQTP